MDLDSNPLWFKGARVIGPVFFAVLWVVSRLFHKFCAKGLSTRTYQMTDFVGFEILTWTRAPPITPKRGAIVHSARPCRRSVPTNPTSPLGLDSLVRYVCFKPMFFSTFRVKPSGRGSSPLEFIHNMRTWRNCHAQISPNQKGKKKTGDVGTHLDIVKNGAITCKYRYSIDMYNYCNYISLYDYYNLLMI